MRRAPAEKAVRAPASEVRNTDSKWISRKPEPVGCEARRATETANQRDGTPRRPRRGGCGAFEGRARMERHGGHRGEDRSLSASTWHAGGGPLLVETRDSSFFLLGPVRNLHLSFAALAATALATAGCVARPSAVTPSAPPLVANAGQLVVVTTPGLERCARVRSGR